MVIAQYYNTVGRGSGLHLLDGKTSVDVVEDDIEKRVVFKSVTAGCAYFQMVTQIYDVLYSRQTKRMGITDDHIYYWIK